MDAGMPIPMPWELLLEFMSLEDTTNWLFHWPTMTSVCADN
jgi:hypothetical protein